MSIQVQGNVGILSEVDGTTYRTLRVSARPVDYGLLGEYKVAGDSGSGTLGSNAFTFSARWTSSSALAVVWGFRIDGFALVSGTPDAASANGTQIYVARNFSSFPVGGTSLLPPTRMRRSMPASLMADVRMTQTNNPVSGGTYTKDFQPIGSFYFSTPASFTTQLTILKGGYNLYGSLEKRGNPAPIVLSTNEGIVNDVGLNSLTAVGVFYAETMAWSEVGSY